MTRDFNKQRRDDSRPFSRNASSSGRRDERPSRPPRPRLNRETVDRGWESGRPRGNNGNSRQPSSNNRWNNQRSEQSSTSYGRRPYSNRQENTQNTQNTQQSGRPPYNSAGPRPRPFDSDRRDNRDYRDRNYSDRPARSDRSDRPRGNQYGSERRDYGDRPHGNGPRPQYRDNARPYEQREQYGQRNTFRSNERNSSSGQDYQRRGPQRFERDNRDSRPPRNFERDHRSRRDEGPPQHRNTQNPRWQSRPVGPRNIHPRQEQFEGDYERFNSPEYLDRSDHQEHPADRPRSFRNSERQNGYEPKEEEHHVTRLPDGRVLKGPRPVQRRNAEFWTGISQDAEKILTGEESATPVESADSKPADKPEKPDKPEKVLNVAKAIRKPRSAAARTRKMVNDQGVTKSKGRGPKPSQRGFKWPTP